MILSQVCGSECVKSMSHLSGLSLAQVNLFHIQGVCIWMRPHLDNLPHSAAPQSRSSKYFRFATSKHARVTALLKASGAACLR